MLEYSQSWEKRLWTFFVKARQNILHKMYYGISQIEFKQHSEEYFRWSYFSDFSSFTLFFCYIMFSNFVTLPLLSLSWNLNIGFVVWYCLGRIGQYHSPVLCSWHLYISLNQKTKQLRICRSLVRQCIDICLFICLLIWTFCMFVSLFVWVFVCLLV